MKWLVDREERDCKNLTAVLEGKLPVTVLQEQQQPTANKEEKVEDELDWFAVYDRKKAEKAALQKLQEEVQRKERRELRLKKMKEDYASTKWQKKRKV